MGHVHRLFCSVATDPEEPSAVSQEVRGFMSSCGGPGGAVRVSEKSVWSDMSPFERPRSWREPRVEGRWS